ncbi:hypothetical protein BB787_28995 (plasmid) [Klebsiella pneumoniae]|uniref:bacteriophage antitermination protein Q n=1 Tax=Klebsiella pneumoniae TaxID=573 RepID=UPI0009384CD5|nr:hypothetical protein BB787_28995 [Klebsiella pneumoniae]
MKEATKKKMRNLTYYAIQQVKASILRGEDVDPLREDEHISRHDECEREQKSGRKRDEHPAEPVTEQGKNHSVRRGIL